MKNGRSSLPRCPSLFPLGAVSSDSLSHDIGDQRWYCLLFYRTVPLVGFSLSQSFEWIGSYWVSIQRRFTSLSSLTTYRAAMSLRNKSRNTSRRNFFYFGIAVNMSTDCSQRLNETTFREHLASHYVWTHLSPLLHFINVRGKSVMQGF